MQQKEISDIFNQELDESQGATEEEFKKEAPQVKRSKLDLQADQMNKAVM